MNGSYYDLLNTSVERTQPENQWVCYPINALKATTGVRFGLYLGLLIRKEFTFDHAVRRASGRV